MNENTWIVLRNVFLKSCKSRKNSITRDDELTPCSIKSIVYFKHFQVELHMKANANDTLLITQFQIDKKDLRK